MPLGFLRFLDEWGLEFRIVQPLTASFRSKLSSTWNKAEGVSFRNLLDHPRAARGLEVRELDASSEVGPGKPANVSLSSKNSDRGCRVHCVDWKTACEVDSTQA